MGRPRSELSKKNKYYICPDRYKELLYFARQYISMKAELTRLRASYPVAPQVSVQHDISNPVPAIVESVAKLADQIAMIEECAYDADPDLWKWILTGITTGKSYEYLNLMMGMPASKDLYYDRYHRFFWLLDAKR